ncbi:MAG: endonuclease III [Clostridiaceae bacterium]|nr:endonuclease III [Clostridiaceae bacterium]
MTRPLRDRARQVTAVLTRHYPGATVTLTHQAPWELLVGAILASQCTDERVNRVTPGLFARFPDPLAMAGADQGELEQLIRSCGLYRSKARALRGTGRMVTERHGGAVPSTREELMALPGVGRKIANLIMGDAFGAQAIVVDTHCARISRLLGFTNSDKPSRIERDLEELVPQEAWTRWGHLMVAHGRVLCRARCRLCFECPVRLLCRYGMALDAGRVTEGGCV